MSAPPPPAAPGPLPLSDADARLWAMLAHLGGLVLSWLVPLIVWLALRERSRYVDEQGKEALNFQITLFLGYLVSAVLMFVLIGFVTAAAVWIAGVVYGILAAVATNRGEPWRYPVAVRLIP